MPVGGRHVHLFAFLHDGLVREFVGYEVADRDEFHSPFVGTAAEFGQSGHASVVAHYLHQGGGREQAGEACEIHGGLGVSRALQHAAVLRI